MSQGMCPWELRYGLCRLACGCVHADVKADAVLLANNAKLA